MIKALRNVVGVSIVFIVGILFFVGFLEFRFDGDYYEKEDCIEATITSLSREKISKPGKKYEYYAQVTYYTDSGHKKIGYMRDGMDKKTDIGDKITAVKDKHGTIRPVKRDWITWKYVELGESNNTLLYLSIGLMIGGIVYFILISLKQEMIVCCIMTLCGIGLKIYSYIHEGVLEIAIGRVAIAIITIAVVMLLIVRAAMVKKRTDSGLTDVNNEINFDAINQYSTEKENKSPGIFNRMTRLMGDKKYTYLGVIYFAVALVLIGIGVYLIWGRGDYSGCSFEFYPKDYDVERNGDDVKITHRSFEFISSLTIGLDPAYRQTSVNAREIGVHHETDVEKAEREAAEAAAEEAQAKREAEEKAEMMRKEMQRRADHLKHLADFDNCFESY